VKKRTSISDYLIIDIGSGAKPLKEATVLCDKFLFSNTYRGGREIVTSNKPLIVADVEALPFRKKAFDFAYCSGVIEYAKEPKRAMEEIKRISRSGYICTLSVIFPNWYKPSTQVFSAYSKNEEVVFIPVPKLSEKMTNDKRNIVIRYFDSIFGMLTGIYVSEIFWGNGMEFFIECYRSNNRELNYFPTFFIKAIVKSRKRLQKMRDMLIERFSAPYKHVDRTTRETQT
jgi:SAM-dependent methyltransferase